MPDSSLARAGSPASGGAPAPPRLRLCVVTGARSEYGLLRHLMRHLQGDGRFELRTVVTGSHFAGDRGLTVREIEADGFVIDERVPTPVDPGSPASLAAAMGACTGGIGGVLVRLAPDLVLLMGDRYEMLAVASACLVSGVPLGHISGGEITEAAMDDQVRHALTKLAHLHFVANEVYAERVRQMGEEPWRVCVSGEPGLDGIGRETSLSREDLERDLGLDLSRPTALVTFHPVTLERSRTGEQIGEVVRALAAAGLQYVLTYPNADPGSEEIVEALAAFAETYGGGVRLVPSLGRTRYLSLLPHVRAMIGNSSSGLVEAPAFRLPAVNVGDRQRGRLRGDNVIDVPCRAEAIVAGIRQALARDRTAPCHNPYGDGQASARIAAFIAAVFGSRSRAEVLRKRFVDRPPAPAPRRHVGGAFEIDIGVLAGGPRQELEDYFRLGPHHALVSSGRAALGLILGDLALGERVLLVPDYLCGDVLLPVVREAGVRWRFYPVGADLALDAGRLGAEPDVGAVLLINYFGLCDHDGLAAALRARRPDVALIQDDVMALYEAHALGPEAHWADYVFASFRKYLPVPDGGFVRARRPLRSAALGPPTARPALDVLAAGVLRHQVLTGTIAPARAAAAEAAYVAMFARASPEPARGPTAMTALSRELVRRLPLDAAAARRADNYRYLVAALAGQPEVRPLRPELPGAAVPLALPVVVDTRARDPLRAFLRQRDIFCPVHWPLDAGRPAAAHPASARLAGTILSLPVDQRYDPERLARLVEGIRDFFGGRRP